MVNGIFSYLNIMENVPFVYKKYTITKAGKFKYLMIIKQVNK